MKLVTLLGISLIAGCTWSNSLYQARLNTSLARAAERDNRTGEAQSFWGIAAVKAESAYVRDPNGKHAPEALWLRGFALSRLNDCSSAARAMETSLVAAPAARWTDNLLLELARCRAVLRDASAAPVFAQLTGSADASVRNEARLAYGRSLVQGGRYEEGLQYLGDFTTRDALLDRAIALSVLRRPGEARQAIDPLVVSGDTIVAWNRLVEPLAAVSPLYADSLIVALNQLPSFSAEQRSQILLGAVRGATDDTIGGRWLETLLRAPPGAAVNAARGIATRRELHRIDSATQLRNALDSTARFEGDIPISGVSDIRHVAELVSLDYAAIKPGAPTGDLQLFALAEVARDTLDAPRLAAAFLQQLEHDWPASPYVGKALLARIALQPDSAAVLRNRLEALTGSLYLGLVRGTIDPSLARLEDSLARFIRSRATLQREAAEVK